MASKKDAPSPVQFKDVEITDIRTGEKKKELDQLRGPVESLGGRVVCLSFEQFGEGSDKERGFEAGKYYSGPMYVVSKDVYQALFGRKGLLNSFYGLGDMSSTRVKQSKERGVTGNFAGDGFQLGGQFVIDTTGEVLLDHRQGFYGDDEDNDGLLAAIKSAKGLAKAE